MDKYEYNVRSEQIMKLIAENEYKTAAKIADSIDWRRVRNVNMLTTVGEVYERCGRYSDAKDILIMAYEKAPIGRRLAYRLTEVCIRMGDLEDAQNYYKDFVNLSPKDNRKYELLYHINKKKGAPAEMLAAILEEYKQYDMDERWSYELALCYRDAGMIDSCVEQCDEIFLWFRDGDYVVKALELKSSFAYLTDAQQEVMDVAIEAAKAAAAEAAAFEAQRLAEIEAHKAAQIQAQRVAEIEALKAAEAKRVAEAEAQRLAEIEARKAEEARLAAEAAAAEAELRQAEAEALRAVWGASDVDLEKEFVVTEDSENMQSDDKTEEKPDAQNMEEVYGEQLELYPSTSFRKVSGDTIDIRKEQGIIRRNFVDEAEEEKKSSAEDDQIEGQMTLDEILTMFEKNDGWEVVNTESTKKEVPEKKEEDPVIEEDIGEAEIDVVTEVGATDDYVETESEAGEEEELPDIESAEADTEELFGDNFVDSISEAVDKVTDEMITDADNDLRFENGLTPDQKEIFYNFLFMKGMEEQLALLFRDVAQVGVGNSSSTGNLLVVGEHKSGKTTMGVDVIKEINRIRGRKGRKIAKISGERLNYKGLRETFSHLQDADLLVEHAGRISKTTLQGLLRFMSGETGGMFVVFEDTKEGMEYILSQVPEARTYFSYYLELREVEVSEWAELAGRYAKEKGFKIDDMAKLALSAKIASLYQDTAIIEFEDIKEIVKAAIRKYNRKHIFKKHKKDDGTYFILKEVDFR
ncbi:MAG: hypothetical protein E7261_05845 [Lachnospiraceae bacterium]|nr:hypothetical protein [Lachnospiraceae bacterium]